MDKLAPALAAFSAGVSAWALGMAVLVEKLVLCITTGDWTQFTFPDWQMAAFAAVFAGPVALAIRKFAKPKE